MAEVELGLKFRQSIAYAAPQRTFRVVDVRVELCR